MSQWLNRLDDVLDSALRPRKRTRPKESTETQPKTAEDAASGETSEAVSVTAEQERPRLKRDDESSTASWYQEGFIQNNHRMVSDANQRASSIHIPPSPPAPPASAAARQQSNGSFSSHTSASSSIRVMPRAAPGRLKRISMTRMAPSPATVTAKQPPSLSMPTPAAATPSNKPTSVPDEKMSQTQLDSPQPLPTNAESEKTTVEPRSTDVILSSQEANTTNSGDTLPTSSPAESADSVEGERSLTPAVPGRAMKTAELKTTIKPVGTDQTEESAGTQSVSKSDTDANTAKNLPVAEEESNKASSDDEDLVDIPLDSTPVVTHRKTGMILIDNPENTKTVDRDPEQIRQEQPTHLALSSMKASVSREPCAANGSSLNKLDTDVVSEITDKEGENFGTRESDVAKHVPKDQKSGKQSLTKAPVVMSPVAEESNQGSTPVASSQKVPFLGGNGETYRPTEARSVRAPSTSKAAGRVIARSASDVEDSSIMSDLQTFPQHVVFRSDFDVENPLKEWDDFSTHVPPYDPSMNCFGVVHVRVLRAQRLPCPVGSSVQAIVSLPPWKGRIRTKKARSFAGSRRRGVCTDWSDDEHAISMVHAYSSEESPVPSIKLEVLFSTFGVFEFNICSLTLSCECLFRQPMMPRRQWFQTVSDEKQSIENIPLLQVEAMFEPEERLVNKSLDAPMDIVEVRQRKSTDDSFLESSSSVLASVTTSTKQTRQPPSRQQSLSDPSLQQQQQLQPVAETKQTQDEISEKNHSLKSLRHTSQADTSQFDDKSDLSVSLVSYRKMTSNVSTKGHLLRNKAFYTPTWCAVCGGSIMSGIWKVLSFHCEECGIDCCSDCRIQVDVQLPCGSEEARKAVEEAAESHLSTDKILQWVAPIEESIHQLTRKPGESHLDTAETNEAAEEPGIGKIKFNFVQAIVLQNEIPAESDASFDQPISNLKRGDYYIRIARSDTTRTQRTQTVQRSTRPQFDSTEMTVTVPNYASEFRVELVDAADDQPIGFVYMTPQMLLQEQRDDAVKQSSLPLPRISFRKRRIVRELRKFVKTGSSSEYFALDGKKTSGNIVGLLEFHVVFQEDLGALYGSSPYVCPSRPKDELDLAKFQGHIRRIGQVIADVKSTIHTFGYVVSWEDPYLTGLSLVAFVSFCYCVHPDHFFTGPAFLAIVYMGYLAFLRTHDGLKHRYLDRELSANRKDFLTPEYVSLHRPVGLLKVNVDGGKNIRSPEMGLPGNVSCQISLDLAHYCDDKQRKKYSTIDGGVGVSHVLGSTDTVYSASPRWRSLIESDESKRLKYVIPTQGGFFDVSGPDESVSELEFPLLQPIARHHKSNELELRRWEDSKGAMVFHVLFHDFANLIPGSEYSLGQVVIPLSEVAEKGGVSGWYKLSQTTESDIFPTTSHPEGEVPAINLTVKWIPPVKIGDLPAEVEREASIVIQEELSRTVKIAQKKSGGIVGSSLGAINTVRGISGYLLAIQNGLGGLLDVIESFRHLVNFSDPLKSSIVLLGLLCLWFVLYSIPFRQIVFLVGMMPYATSLKSKYDKLSLKKKRRRSSYPSTTKDQKKDKASPFSAWVTNFNRSLPIDDDLRKTYFWETRRSVAKQLRQEADARRVGRLQKLWRAQWYEMVEIMKSGDGRSGEIEFLTSFAVIQGRRFMWWKSEQDFDGGEQPTGRIFLQGHAGLATPSPIELKAMGDKSSRAVSLFGRGLKDQERITFLVSGEKSKESFEDAVMSALYTKDA